MLSSKINCKISKTKNVPFFKGDDVEKQLLSCSLRHRSQSSYSPLVSQIPQRHGSQELLRLLLNKLNFPASPVSAVPRPTKAPWPKRTNTEWPCMEGVPSWDRRFAVSLPRMRKGLRAGAPGRRDCGVVYPILPPFGNPLPSISVPILTGVSMKIFWGLDTPKKPQLLNFWPALSYWIICQVAAFFSFVAWTLAIIKTILEALTEHWFKSFPQSLTQNH